MRIARVTYKGAYHHVMNRGIEGKNIFPDDKAKQYFFNILCDKSRNLKIRLLALCIMDSHYHLTLQNSSGRLSDFMKQLDGQYGIYYRNREGGKGYVFQGRYKSTLIQEDKYLKAVIVYILLNPVRAGIIIDPYKYRWSSIQEYFVSKGSNIVDNEFVEGLYGSRIDMKKLLKDWLNKDIEVRKTRIGDIIGDDDFVNEAFKKYDRRKIGGETKRMRIEDYIFETAAKVIENFEEEKVTKIDRIDINTLEGKGLRSELLVQLKDRAGLKYTDIIEYPIFKSLKYSSLGQLYRKAKEHVKRKIN